MNSRIVFDMEFDDFVSIHMNDLEENIEHITDLIGNGATSGKTLDGKITWELYNEDNDF